MNFWEDKTVLITGGFGFVGTNLMYMLSELGPEKIVAPTREACDLTDPYQTDALLARIEPDIVLHCAGKVGGIGANKATPGEFLYQNLMMGTNIM